jgi:hypothetical protein
MPNTTLKGRQMAELHTPELLLPAQSFEEALPFLRRPYTPSQVQAKIVSTPEIKEAPCTIALYAIGETPMDRFNLVCAREWTHSFETLAEEKTVTNGKTSWYCMVCATITVFGISKPDIGESTAPTRAAAEMNARAQAYKRAGRWFGPGQCLYAAYEIIMFRGKNADELRVPAGDKGYLRPYFDRQGQGQKYVRGRYEHWLTDSGEEVYGEPLNHLKIAEAIQARMSPRAAVLTAPLAPTLAVVGQGAPATPTLQEPLGDLASPNQAPATAPERATGPMPDIPASAATIGVAQSHKYTELAAKALTNLAANQGQTGALSEAQERVVANWLAAMARFKVTEAMVLEAVEVAAGKYDCQETRQAKLAKWLSAKAQADPTSTPDIAAAGSEQADAASETNQAGQQDTTATGTGAPQGDGEPSEAEAQELAIAQAYVRIHRAMKDHGYDDQVVTRLAALALGAGPRGRVSWDAVPAEVLVIIAELLEAAAKLAWSNDTLTKEVIKAHNKTQQGTSTGRFAAFANHLMNAAETASEAA